MSGIKNILLGGLAHEGKFNVKDGTVIVTGNVVSDREITNSDVTGADNTLNFLLIIQPKTLRADGLSLVLDFARRHQAGPSFGLRLQIYAAREKREAPL